MSPSEQAKQLERFLGDLPARHVRKLALVLERQRSSGRGRLPHDAIMRLLRPSLAAMRTPRHLTPQRALCAPFEDLLRPDDPEIKKIGAISRAAIPVMWALLKELEAEKLEALCQNFTEVQQTGDPGATAEASQALWRLAAETLKEPVDRANSDRAEFKAFAKKIGGTRRAEDLTEMQAVLEIALTVEHIKALLPRKPIRRLSDDHITLVSRVYAELAAQQTGHETYLLIVVMGRLEQKFELMKIIRNMSPKMDDTLATRTDLKFVGDRVIAALEDEAEAIDAAGGEHWDEDRFMKIVRRYATDFKGITGEIGIRRDGAWGHRMFTSRTIVSEAIEQKLLRNARATVLSPLPTTAGPKGVTVAAPDFSMAIDGDAYLVAERRARAVRDTTNMAEQLGVSNSSHQVTDILKRELDQYGAMLLERVAKVQPDQVGNATNHLYVTVRLIELVSGAEDADLLRRRGVAGLGLPAQPMPDGDDSPQTAILSGRADDILRPDPIA